MGVELLLRGVELHPRQGPVDCRIRDGVIAELGRRLRPGPDGFVAEGNGGALLPGLADHHVHLSAMAAHHASLHVSALSRDGLASSLAQAAAGQDGWVRVVGYDDVVHGDLDRTVLDVWNHVLPVRVQHRSGALWVVNSPGLERLGAASASCGGIERDGAGRPSGRLWRADAWLREAVGGRPPSLQGVGARLAALGITHVTDATPDAGTGGVVAEAVLKAKLPQHVMVMAAVTGLPPHPRLSLGPLKLVVADHALPDVDDLTGRIRRAHTDGRPVAVHCVTRTALALTLAALDRAGALEGDRVEHCALADPAAAGELAARRIRVVTQPTLIALRGDDYWDRADTRDRPDLWRYAGLLRAGVRVAASSDAPYGDPDPWACLRAASQRLTPSGRVLGAEERVPVQVALRGMLSPLGDPGGPARRVAVGRPADLVLLDRPLREALRAPDAGHVRATFIEGRIVHGADRLG